MKQLAGRRLPVVVSSPGGEVHAALEVGRLIRQNKLDVAVGLTRFEGCHPSAKDCKLNKGKAAAFYGTAFVGGAYCASACPLIVAGGVRRVVGAWAYLGVHQITTTHYRTKIIYRTKYKVVKGKKRIIETKEVGRKNAGSYKTYEMDKAIEKKLAAYLKEMGVGDAFLVTMKNTPATTLHVIEPYNMRKMNLITSLDDVQLLTGAAVCKAVPAAANCRFVTPPPTPKVESTPTPTVELTPPPKVEPTTTPKPKVEPTPKPRLMQFVVVRTNDTACEPTCPEWISAEGAIGAETPALLAAMLKTIGGRKLPIVLFSAGGDMDAAMEMGRQIRRAGLQVIVGRTWFVGCRPEEKGCNANDGKGADFFGRALSAGGYCASECMLMLAGGARRHVPDQAVLRVRSKGPKMSNTAALQVVGYLKELGIDRSALDLVNSSAGNILDVARLRDVGLVFDNIGAEIMTDAGICKALPAPDNCRVLTALDLEK